MDRGTEIKEEETVDKKEVNRKGGGEKDEQRHKQPAMAAAVGHGSRTGKKISMCFRPDRVRLGDTESYILYSYRSVQVESGE